MPQTATNTEQRSTKRFNLPVSAVVQIRENDNSIWKQTANLITVSRNGAGFHLSKECRLGQLISLIMPLPKHLRRYDYEKPLYRIWGLVQHSFPLVSGDEKISYHIGVAFIGKSAPDEFENNPMQSYRLCGMKKDGLWEIVAAQNSFVTRKASRFWTSLDVSLEIPETTAKEETNTENISSDGASVFSTLEVEVGDSITFTSEQYDFHAQAVVRNSKVGSDERRRLHLQFIDAKFPIKQVTFPAEEAQKNDAPLPVEEIRENQVFSS